jgi:hypothetical protein
VADKGLNINPFAVAHKIANEGIKVPNQNNSGRLLSDTFTPAWLDTLASEAAGHQLKEVKTLFLNKLDS